MSNLTWYRATMEFALDHTDPACPSSEAVFDDFVDATPTGLIDASHSMGPADDVVIVPRPTPDEDGVYWASPSLRTRMATGRHAGQVALEITNHTWWVDPADAEALGSALIAAAQDVTRPPPR